MLLDSHLHNLLAVPLQAHLQMQDLAEKLGNLDVPPRQPFMPPRRSIILKRTAYYASTAKKKEKNMFRRFWPFYEVFK